MQNALARHSATRSEPLHGQEKPQFVLRCNKLSTLRCIEDLARSSKINWRIHTPIVLSAVAPRRLSLAIAAMAFVVLAGVGILQFFKDGSFWLDEASLAFSLLQLEPLQSFGPLVGGQSFPRLYLLAVHGLVGVFGYETMVVRFLPQLFFSAATLALLRLLFERFRNQPHWVALGALLLAVPANWFLYGAMFKSYTLDVFVSTIPFLLRDDFYDDVLVRGQQSWRLLVLGCLGVLSYPLLMVLLARVGGWWLQRFATGRGIIALRSVAFGSAGLAISAVWLWSMEFRHTLELGGELRSFWSPCLVGGADVDSFALLDRFLFGWFDGRAKFATSQVATLPLAALRLAFVAGFIRIVVTLAPRGGLPAPSPWGSRSLGYAGLLAGLPIAS
jgi:hypothetical protein